MIMKTLITKGFISIFLLFTLHICSAQNANLLFYNVDSTALYSDMVTVVTLNKDNHDNSYNSITYFTISGFLELPYNKDGYNVIIITCDDNLMLYLPPREYFYFYLTTCDYDNRQNNTSIK